MKNIYRLGIVVVSLYMTSKAYSAVIQDAEFESALQWWYEMQMTQYSWADAYRPFDLLTREQGAKMLATFAMKNLCIVPDESLVCEFSDLESADTSLQPFLITACQLGLFQWFGGKFLPHEPLTKAQALTVLSRAIDGKQDETQTPRWSIYFEKARQHGMTKETDVWKLDNPITRYETLLIQYRARANEQCGKWWYSDGLLKALSELFGEDINTQPVSDEVIWTGTPLATCSDDCSAPTIHLTVAPKDATHPVQQWSSMAYVVEWNQGAPITVRRGWNYTFIIDAPEIHPRYITTDPIWLGFGSFSTGVHGNFTSSGLVTRTVPMDAPNTLYYQCGNHPSMWGEIQIVDRCCSEEIE